MEKKKKKNNKKKNRPSKNEMVFNQYTRQQINYNNWAYCSQPNMKCQKCNVKTYKELSLKLIDKNFMK